MVTKNMCQCDLYIGHFIGHGPNVLFAYYSDGLLYILYTAALLTTGYYQSNALASLND